jgi:hypothetical protein
MPTPPPKGTGNDTGHEHPARGGARDGFLLRLAMTSIAMCGSEERGCPRTPLEITILTKPLLIALRPGTGTPPTSQGSQ